MQQGERAGRHAKNRTPGENRSDTVCHHLDLLKRRIKTKTGPSGWISIVTRRLSLPSEVKTKTDKTKNIKKAICESIRSGLRKKWGIIYTGLLRAGFTFPTPSS